MSGRLPAAPLSDREIQLLSFASQGLSAKEIAREMMTTPRIVDQHFENLIAKTGARNRTHLMVRAFQCGYFDL